MSTTIAPSSGAAPLYTQGGTGTSPGYSALDDRRAGNGALQEGVWGTATTVTAGGVSSVAAADFMVTQRASGANMSVDINMPGGGCAFVQGDTIAGQGLYRVDVHSANINETIATANATNPRIDQIILEVQDDTLDASGGNLARTRVLTGTATSGATLANRSGAATLPGSALLLADVLVAANASSIANTAIRDRRTWARGAFFTATKTSPSYSTNSTTAILIDSATLNSRYELTPGNVVRCTLRTSVSMNTAGAAAIMHLGVNSAVTARGVQLGGTNYPANLTLPAAIEWNFAPTGGSTILGPMWLVNSGTVTVLSTQDVEWTVEEIVRQTATNNAVTTG